MTLNNLPSLHDDKDADRRRVLAQVYDLLIRLAEEAERQAVPPDTVIEDAVNVAEPTPVQLELLL